MLRKMELFQAALIVTLTPLLLGCPSAPVNPARLGGPSPIHVLGAYLHDPSGMEFPAQLGAFERRRILRYDPDANEISVRYDLVRPGQEIAATVYLYPCKGECGHFAKVLEREFDALKTQILSLHPEAGLLYEGDMQLEQDGKILEGKKAIFRFEDVFVFRMEALLSQAYIFKRGKWFIEYRFTCPQTEYDKVKGEFEGFARSFRWPGTRRKKTLSPGKGK